VIYTRPVNGAASVSREYKDHRDVYKYKNRYSHIFASSRGDEYNFRPTLTRTVPMRVAHKGHGVGKRPQWFGECVRAFGY
jgi:hypothetical protein